MSRSPDPDTRRAATDRAGDCRHPNPDPGVRRRARRPSAAAPEDSPLTAARRAFEMLTSGSAPLAIDGRPYPGLPDRPIPLDELRRLLMRATCPPTTHDLLWRALVTRSRQGGAVWTIGCVGVARPALATVTGQLCARYAGDRLDVHAAVLCGFLDALAGIDLTRPKILARLRWSAYRAGYAVVREKLDAPTPCAIGFGSAPPPVVSGHPDFVLADAVTAGVITADEADLIGDTRLEQTPLRVWAADRDRSYEAVRKARQRAEARLVEFLHGRMRGEDPTQNPATPARTAKAAHRPPARTLIAVPAPDSRQPAAAASPEVAARAGGLGRVA